MASSCPSADWGTWSFPSPQHQWGHTWSGFWDPSNRETWTVGRVQWRVTKVMKRLKHLSCEQRLTELGPFGLEKWVLGADGMDLISVYKTEEKRGSHALSSVIPSDRIRGDLHILKNKWLIPSKHSPIQATRKLSCCLGQHQNTLEYVEFPFLVILKSHLDMFLGHQVWVVLLEQRSWTRWPPDMPFNLSYSVISLSAETQREGISFSHCTTLVYNVATPLEYLSLIARVCSLLIQLCLVQ